MVVWVVMGRKMTIRELVWEVRQCLPEIKRTLVTSQRIVARYRACTLISLNSVPLHQLRHWVE